MRVPADPPTETPEKIQAAAASASASTAQPTRMRSGNGHVPIVAASGVREDRQGPLRSRRGSLRRRDRHSSPPRGKPQSTSRCHAHRKGFGRPDRDGESGDSRCTGRSRRSCNDRPHSATSVRLIFCCLRLTASPTQRSALAIVVSPGRRAQTRCRAMARAVACNSTGRARSDDGGRPNDLRSRRREEATDHEPGRDSNLRTFGLKVRCSTN